MIAISTIASPHCTVSSSRVPIASINCLVHANVSLLYILGNPKGLLGAHYYKIDGCLRRLSAVLL
jgi:hypothetical protein